MPRQTIKNNWTPNDPVGATDLNNIGDNLLYILDENTSFSGNKAFSGTITIGTPPVGAESLQIEGFIRQEVTFGAIVKKMITNDNATAVLEMTTNTSTKGLRLGYDHTTNRVRLNYGTSFAGVNSGLEISGSSVVSGFNFDALGNITSLKDGALVQLVSADTTKVAQLNLSSGGFLDFYGKVSGVNTFHTRVLNTGDWMLGTQVHTGEKLKVSGNTFLDGTLKLSGNIISNTTIDGTLNVTGNTDINGNITGLKDGALLQLVSADTTKQVQVQLSTDGHYDFFAKDGTLNKIGRWLKTGDFMVGGDIHEGDKLKVFGRLRVEGNILPTTTPTEETITRTTTGTTLLPRGILNILLKTSRDNEDNNDNYPIITLERFIGGNWEFCAEDKPALTNKTSQNMISDGSGVDSSGSDLRINVTFTGVPVNPSGTALIRKY